MHIGNDIASLNFNLQDERFLKQRYLDKLFTINEQKYIWATDMPAYALWLLWTAKESAYKVYNRQTGQRMYHPKKFEVQIDDNLFSPYIKSVELHSTGEEEINKNPPLVLYGTVTTPQSNLSVCFFPAHKFIHTLATESKLQLNNIHWGISSINSTSNKEQSLQVRKLAKKRLADYLNVPSSELSIIRHIEKGKLGPPEIYFEGNKLNTGISLTHDSNMVAYAFL